MKDKKTDTPICALDYAFQRMGGKHKARILWYIYEKDNTMRFSELKKRVPNISSKILSQNLRSLEEDELITRKVYPEVPPRVVYSVTETALELIPLIEKIGDWGRSLINKEIKNSKD